MGGFLVRTEEMRVRFPLGPPDYVGRGRVAQASDCDSLHESSILSGQPISVAVVGQALSPANSVVGQVLSPANSVVGQALSPANSLRASFNGKDGTLRTFKWGFDSLRLYHPAFVQQERTQRSER